MGMGRVRGSLAAALAVTGIVFADEVIDDEPANVEVSVAAPASAPFLTAAEIQAGAEPPEYAGMLDAHNFWRREVGAPDLQWSPQAAVMAQKWADDLATQDCPMRHNLAPERKKVFGENIYRYWRTSAYEPYHRQPKYVVDAWGAESLWFDGSSNVCRAPSGGTCGHYTQVVWTYSKMVGCGRSHCGDSEVWVCEYFPRGNFVGIRPFAHSSAEANAVFPMPSEEEVMEMMDGAPEEADVAPQQAAAEPVVAAEPVPVVEPMMAVEAVLPASDAAVDPVPAPELTPAAEGQGAQ